MQLEILKTVRETVYVIELLWAVWVCYFFHTVHCVQCDIFMFRSRESRGVLASSASLQACSRFTVIGSEDHNKPQNTAPSVLFWWFSVGEFRSFCFALCWLWCFYRGPQEALLGCRSCHHRGVNCRVEDDPVVVDFSQSLFSLRHKTLLFHTKQLFGSRHGSKDSQKWLCRTFLPEASVRLSSASHWLDPNCSIDTMCQATVAGTALSNVWDSGVHFIENDWATEPHHQRVIGHNKHQHCVKKKAFCPFISMRPLQMTATGNHIHILTPHLTTSNSQAFSLFSETSQHLFDGFCRHSWFPSTIYPNYFNGVLNFPLPPTWGWHFSVLIEISQLLDDWLSFFQVSISLLWV